MKALAELERLQNVSRNSHPSKWEQAQGSILKIFSLNCHSLPNKIEDLRNDPFALKSDIICLTETWLQSDTALDTMEIPGYDVSHNSLGKGKGVSTYFRYNMGKPSVTVNRQKVQISMLETEEVNVINIYRSQGADNQEIMRDLLQMISKDKPSLICGDFNLCYIDERDNQITRMLEDQNFKQLVTEASHFQGGHIDHVYSNLNPAMFEIEVSMYSPYYTSRDHDGFCTSITHKQK